MKQGKVTFIRDGVDEDRRMYLKFKTNEGISFVTEQELQVAKDRCFFRSYYFCDEVCQDILLDDGQGEEEEK